jgi:hypothetical protein
VSCVILLASCAKTPVEETTQRVQPAKLNVSSWVPNITGVGSGNNKGTVTQTITTSYYSNVPMVRLNQAWTGKEFVVDLGVYATDANSDGIADEFGPNGSMSLIAEVQNYPLTGGAYPVLSAFWVDDGSTTLDFINIPRPSGAPTTEACFSNGMYSCLGGVCSPTLCAPGASSAFVSRSDWDQHQIPPFGYGTTNTFPRCDAGVSNWTNCPAGMGSLKPGHYYARYVLLSDSANSVDGRLVQLKVTKVVKRDTSVRGASPASVNGSIDLNVILVGDDNVVASNTAKGAQNLNLLYEEVSQILKSSTGVGIGRIDVYSFSDADGGAPYAYPDVEDIGTLFYAGSAGVKLIDSTSDGRAINVFMVRDIGSSSNTSITILGVAGAIQGPMINGLETSGLAFSTYNTGFSNPSLGGYNPSCTLSSCTRAMMEEEFLEMAATIAHELGHFLGLNHLSERKGSGTQRHDRLADTPLATENNIDSNSSLTHIDAYKEASDFLLSGTCETQCDAAIVSTYSAFIGTKKYYTSNSTSSKTSFYCSTVQACQFNHVMWYTTKNRQLVSGVWREDGNLISTQSSAVIQWSPFVK